MKQTRNEEQQIEELAALLDNLFSSGTQHINLQIGEDTKIQTVNSTECNGKPGACSIPNAEIEENEED